MQNMALSLLAFNSQNYNETQLKPTCHKLLIRNSQIQEQTAGVTFSSPSKD
jgi:hypothetical protein